MSSVVWPVMTSAQAEEAEELWATGAYDTRAIASMLFVRESEVANHLSAEREGSHRLQDVRGALHTIHREIAPLSEPLTFAAPR